MSQEQNPSFEKEETSIEITHDPSEEELVARVMSMDPFAEKEEPEPSPGIGEERPPPKGLMEVDEVSDRDIRADNTDEWWEVWRVTSSEMEYKNVCGTKDVPSNCSCAPGWKVRCGVKYTAHWKPFLAQKVHYFVVTSPSMKRVPPPENLGFSDCHHTAFMLAKDIITRGTSKERTQHIGYYVCGPFYRTPEDPPITREEAEENVAAIVSTRVYNQNRGEKFGDPQVTMVSRGRNSSLQERDIKVRFPGGVVPFKKIREFTEAAVEGTLPEQPPDGASPELYEFVRRIAKGNPTLQAAIEQRLAMEEKQ